MKTLTVKFSRNPQYTPSSLTAHQLARIERLARAFFLRTATGANELGWDMVWTGKEAVVDMTTGWFAPVWRNEAGQGLDTEEKITTARKARHSTRWAKVLTPDGKKYFSNCYAYLIAIAKRNGDIQVESHSRQWYAERRGGYN